jgi:hypothetical protein
MAAGCSMLGDGESGCFPIPKILAAKRADTGADTSVPEREIDRHVYALYGLTPEEIKIVEKSSATR